MASPRPPPFGRFERLPATSDEGVRVDFEGSQFDQAIAAHGYRLAWSRRAECPCAPVSYQLTQPSPNCPMCEGTGDLYFGPQVPQDLSAEVFSEPQLEVVRDPKIFLIRGVMQPLTSREKRNDQLGSWLFGGSSLTVLAENRLNFRDRLVNLDAVTTYAEVVQMPPAPELRLPLRYVVAEAVYFCQDGAGRRFYPEADFTLPNGRVVFLPGRGPEPGARVSVAYLTYPCWLVEDHMHRDRVQAALSPEEAAAMGLRGTEGYIQRLPTQARVSLEFIPSRLNRGE